MKIEELVAEVKKVKPGVYTPMSWVSSTYNHKGNVVTFVCDGYVRLNINYENTKAGKEAATAHKVKGTTPRETWFEHDEECFAICRHKRDPKKVYLQIFLSHAKDITTGEDQPTTIRKIWNLGKDDESEITPDTIKGGAKTIEALDAKREKHDQPKQVFLKPIEDILSIGEFYKVK